MSTLQTYVKALGKVILSYYNIRADKEPEKGLHKIAEDKFDELLDDPTVSAYLEEKISEISSYQHRKAHLECMLHAYNTLSSAIALPEKVDNWPFLNAQLAKLTKVFFSLRQASANVNLEMNKTVLFGKTFGLSTTAAYNSLPIEIPLFGKAVYQGRTSDFGRCVRKYLLNMAAGMSYERCKPEDVEAAIDRNIQQAVEDFKKEISAKQERLALRRASEGQRVEGIAASLSTSIPQALSEREEVRSEGGRHVIPETKEEQPSSGFFSGLFPWG